MDIKGNILLVEDEANFASVMKSYLELSGYHVRLCMDGNAGLAGFKEATYDLCILDVMMPKRDGFSLAEEIRAINQQVPLIFLTAKSMKEDMLRGYRAGADDYLTKPFDSEILLMKIERLLERAKVEVKQEEEVHEFGSFTYHTRSRELFHGESRQQLSPKEGQLLQLLCVHLNDVMPREKALRQIWKDSNYFTTRSMDVYIAKLRKYLSPDPNINISNVHGSGYKLEVAIPS